jgi:putative tryptophan/tyrosine transport system substrate-binding protein
LYEVPNRLPVVRKREEAIALLAAGELRVSRQSNAEMSLGPRLNSRPPKDFLQSIPAAIYVHRMFPISIVLKKIALGLTLIGGSAAILLYSDLDSRNHNSGDSGNASRPMRVAIVQQASVPPLEDGVRGALAALKERGYVDGGRIVVRRYNAQGDIATANAIAKEVTSGNYDLIFSVSTVSLQTVANANRFATPPRRHVFSIVTDPYAVGVGVSRENHAIHPPYMTGIGSVPPVEDIFRLAKQMRPSLKRVGLVWDPSEANSVVSTGLGRSVCASLGITLVEANAENATMVGEATASLLARGIEAIWVSPDLVTSQGQDVIMSKAKTAKIPVFTSAPRDSNSGSLFDLGANYEAIGHQAGELVADVLDGRNPAQVPVENLSPVKLQVNRLALKGLRDQWDLPDSVVQRAQVVIDETGRHVQGSSLSTADAGKQASLNREGTSPK